MTTHTSVVAELVAFLHARLDEAEAVADEYHHMECEVGMFGCNCGYPTHVLADVAAKRAIINWCSSRDQIFIPTVANRDETDPNNYIPGDLTHGADSPVLRMLATVYADHPDYRAEEWRP